MTAKTGEKAQKTGGFHCAHRSEEVHVTQGDKIPSCPNGHREFEIGPAGTKPA
ncbi:hypothetical protein ACFUTR_33755 [Streptomyces sp. NPDC057367]|uniref:hypothetical protein n=1 Tax=Streptomyces sp. NPDC057367 TaxID=3346108 RepID=UPI00363A1554